MKKLITVKKEPLKAIPLILALFPSKTEPGSLLDKLWQKLQQFCH